MKKKKKKTGKLYVVSRTIASGERNKPCSEHRLVILSKNDPALVKQQQKSCSAGLRLPACQGAERRTRHQNRSQAICIGGYSTILGTRAKSALQGPEFALPLTNSDPTRDLEGYQSTKAHTRSLQAHCRTIDQGAGGKNANKHPPREADVARAQLQSSASTTATR